MDEKPQLPSNIRVLIGIISIPSLVLALMLCASIYTGDYKSIGSFEVIYSAVGIFALFIAVTGKRYF